jgi:hypothetical protein
MLQKIMLLDFKFMLQGGDYFGGPITRFDIPLFWHTSVGHFPEFHWEVSIVLFNLGC